MTAKQLIPAIEFCRHHHIEVSFLRSLHEYGCIVLIDSDGDNYLEADDVLWAEKLLRLHYDLQINLEGLDVIHRLLQREDELKSEIASLRNKLSFLQAH